MLGEAEEKCTDLIFDFISKNADFRPIPMEEEISPSWLLDDEKLFMLIKGSYATRNICIGVMINNNLSEVEYESHVSLCYILPCKSNIAIMFLKEKPSDKVTKKIGLDIEIEVGNKEIDDNYLINSNFPDVLAKMSGESPLKDFLLEHIPDLQILGIKNGIIQFQRAFSPHKDTVEKMARDITQVINIAKSFEQSFII